MPRPQKIRKVGFAPVNTLFSPQQGKADIVYLGYDEIEAIRLLDLEGMDQGECAEKMGIARSTIQNVINEAHRKVAEALVHGKRIQIAGGNFEFLEEVFTCRKNRMVNVSRTGGISDFNNKERPMKIAVTFDKSNGEVFQHFGKTEYFKIYQIDDGKITASEVVSTEGKGHGALAGFLKERGVEALICGGIGGGAQAALADGGIKLYGGTAGNADALVNDFIAGKLVYQEDVKCDHHGEHHHHGEGHEGGHCGCHGEGRHHGEGHGHCGCH